MARGIKLFKVLGIQISIDYTWFIVFVLFAWSLSAGYFPFRNPGYTPGTYFVMGIISALLLFACVLIHEIFHSYTSNRLGLEIKEITLFIFGGVAELTKEPDDAASEFKIAVAGPVASAILALLFGLASAVVSAEAYPILNAILAYLALINVVLLIFNMIPGFPLDGGRILRAAWWARTGDLDRATKVASMIGKGFALFLILTGFLQIFTGNFTGGLWSVLIGVFVQQAADSGYKQVVIKRALEGVKVKDLMSRGVVTVDENANLSEVVNNYFFRYHFISFPVTSNSHVSGLLTLNKVRGIDRHEWEKMRVKDVMKELSPEDTLSPEDDAMDALARMTAEQNSGRFPVLDKGVLVGIISRRDIIKLLEFKTGLQR
ncbi:MAG: site-2 protease family protein [Deltaproteobacteria bacterium]|nr:site-2 protease family protein [Deltaproteobacteria bacterium]